MESYTINTEDVINGDMKMVVGLDGIERVLEAINPDTHKLDGYVCGGYHNTGYFIKSNDPKIPDKLVPGKLVDWYRPLSGRGQSHSLEYLELFGQMTGNKVGIYIAGSAEFNRTREKYDGKKE